MLTLLSVAVVVLVPVGCVTGLLTLAHAVGRRRDRVIARQIALTDAIHRELGAVAAPVLRQRGRSWQVRVGVPLERFALVARLVEIVQRTMEPVPFELVLTRSASQVTPPRSRRVGSAPGLTIAIGRSAYAPPSAEPRAPRVG